MCSGSVSIYTDPNPAIIKQKIKKTLISTGTLPSLKTGVNKPKFSKGKKKLSFVDVLKTTEEKSRPRIRNPVVRSDPRIRKRIKMLRIRNTGVRRDDNILYFYL